MISGLDGTPVWAILMTTSEVDEGSASVSFSVQVRAIAGSESVARDLAYELVPYIPRDASLAIEETVLVDF